MVYCCEKYTENSFRKKGCVSSYSLSRYGPSWQLKYGQRQGVTSQDAERDECWCSSAFLFSTSYSACDSSHMGWCCTLSSVKPGNILRDVSPMWFKIHPTWQWSWTITNGMDIKIIGLKSYFYDLSKWSEVFTLTRVPSRSLKTQNDSTLQRTKFSWLLLSTYSMSVTTLFLLMIVSPLSQSRKTY